MIDRCNSSEVQLSDDTPAQRFLGAFWRLKRTLIDGVSSTLKAEFGVDLSELMLLRRIAHTDLSPSELAEELRVPASLISRKLDSLEANGLILRTLDKGDARRRVLSLSEGGVELLQPANAVLEREIDQVLNVLDRERLDQFFESLEAISRNKQENQ